MWPIISRHRSSLRAGEAGAKHVLSSVEGAAKGEGANRFFTGNLVLKSVSEWVLISAEKLGGSHLFGFER